MSKRTASDTMFIEVETINDEGHMIEVSKIMKRYKNELEQAGVDCNVNYKGKNDDEKHIIRYNDDDEKDDDQPIFKFGENKDFKFNFDYKIKSEISIDSANIKKQVENNVVSSEIINKSDNKIDSAMVNKQVVSNYQ